MLKLSIVLLHNILIKVCPARFDGWLVVASFFREASLCRREIRKPSPRRETLNFFE